MCCYGIDLGASIVRAIRVSGGMSGPLCHQVERVEVKDVRVPEQLQRAMAAEAEAAREARAKVIAAEGEHILILVS